MSCRECSGLMHKEQAARAQKMGAGDSQTLLPLANWSNFRARGEQEEANGPTFICESPRSACWRTSRRQNLHAYSHTYSDVIPTRRGRGGTLPHFV